MAQVMIHDTAIDAIIRKCNQWKQKQTQHIIIQLQIMLIFFKLPSIDDAIMYRHKLLRYFAERVLLASSSSLI